MRNNDRNYLIWRAAELFFTRGLTPQATAKAMTAELQSGDDISRQDVYPMLHAAFERGLIRLAPPSESELRKRLCETFGLRPDRTHVVVAGPTDEGDRVANVAAAHVMQLAKSLAAARGVGQPVGLGLGPGGTTLAFSRHLGAMLRNDAAQLRLALFALTAGGPVHRPEQSPVGFFNLFPEGRVARRVGLFAETLVPAKAFGKIKMRPGISEAFDAKQDIDIVVTAMGDMQDEHDLLSDFLRESGVDTTAMKAAGWIGNVQYRPFSKSGPVVEPDEMPRAVTLFELDELAALARQREKWVVLMVRPCRDPGCGNSHAGALLALLQSSPNHVFSDLVIDERTARDLLTLVHAGTRLEEDRGVPAKASGGSKRVPRPR